MLLLSENAAVVFGNTRITKWKVFFDVVHKLDEREANEKCKDLEGEVQEKQDARLGLALGLGLGRMLVLLKMYRRQEKGFEEKKTWMVFM